MLPRQKVKIKWSSSFAYAIGLLVTDGCLSRDGRHIEFTSKDILQIKTLLRCLDIDVLIRQKQSGTRKKHYCVQFSDVIFYRFLLSIGLSPNKTKTIAIVTVPKKYFTDFLRGHFDGDGSFYAYWDPRWPASYMFYVSFVSASKNHILWLRMMIEKYYRVHGHITKSKNSSVYQLKYAKKESLRLLGRLYYYDAAPCLERKRVKIEKALGVVGVHI